MRQNNGFTLVELLFCLALFAGLSLMGLALGQNLSRNRQLVLSHEVVGALNHAKQLAVLRAYPLLLHGLADDWSKGAILCADNREHRCQNPDDILYQWSWEKPGIRLSWQGFLSSDYIVFSANPSQSACSGSFHLFNQGMEKQKISLNRIGHIRFHSIQPIIRDRG